MSRAERPEQPGVSGYRHGRVPHAVRAEQLREVALALFAERGYHATSIEDIRRAAGISRPVFYDHFESKEAVYIACLQRARELLDTSIASGVDAAEEPERQLWSGICGYFEFAERDPRSWQLLFGGGDAVTGPAAEEETRGRLGTIGLIASLMQRAVPAADARTMEVFAHGLAGSGEQIALWWGRNPAIPRERVARYLMDVAWGGMEAVVRGAERPQR